MLNEFIKNLNFSSGLARSLKVIRRAGRLIQ